MARLTATAGMMDGAAAQAARKAEERGAAAEYERQADERRSAKQAEALRQREAYLASEDGQAMLRRRVRLAEAAERLATSERWANIDSFTAMVRGMRVSRGVLKVMAPNVHVLDLYAPKNGKGQLITEEHLAAATDYAALHDQIKLGGASRDPEQVRVQGGGAGCMELAFLNRLDAVQEFKRAQLALQCGSILPKWGAVIRRIVEWVVLDEGHPLADFDVSGFAPLQGPEPEKACRALLFRQGLDGLCQHFRQSG